MKALNPIKNRKKKCNICGKIKYYSHFGKAKNVKSGYRGDCKACQSVSRLKRRTRRSERIYEAKKFYGLSEKQYDALVKTHKHSCALCGKHRSQQQRDLHIDHDHRTGKVRGLLCCACNARLGWYENRKELIQNYLVGAK